jgi:hypothetical protein
VLESALRLTALVTAMLVLASFGLFARDQFSGASKNQQQRIVDGAPHVPGLARRSTRHKQPRRFIDGAAHKLESPFASVVDSPDSWVKHGVPAFLGLLVYGAGLGFVARYAHGRT